MSIPALTSRAGTVYGGSFPDSLWEQISTRWSGSFSLPCAEPGCEVSSDVLVTQLGIDLPTTSPWPAAPSPATLRDDDEDGEPGVPYVLDRAVPLPASDDSFAPPWQAARAGWQVDMASELMLALRFTARLEGKVDRCGSASGSAGALALDSHVLSCRLDSGSLCSVDQAGALNSSLPSWQISGASWRMVALDAASCAAARAALP